jgi:hypothetical protein
MNDNDFIREFNKLVIECMKSTDTVDPLTKINDNLFLGQGRTTLYGGMLWKLGITHVLSISRTPHGSVLKGPFQRLEIFDAPDIDQTCLINHFPQAFDFIKKALAENGKIYIHCEMGCSRAATIVIAYLRFSEQYTSLQSAYDYVKSIRPWIYPNLGFQEQLKIYFLEPLECVR